MKQKVIIVLVVILAIVLGVVGFMVYRVVDLDNVLNRVKDNAQTTNNYLAKIGMHTSETDKARVYEVYYLNGKVYTNDELSQVKQYANYDGKSYTFVETNGYNTYSVVDSEQVKSNLNPFEERLYSLSFWDKLTKIEVNNIDYLIQKDQNEYIKCIEIVDKSRKVENSDLDYKAKYIINAETFEPVSVYENTGSSESIHDFLSIEKGVVTEEMMKLPNIDDYREVKSN